MNFSTKISLAITALAFSFSAHAQNAHEAQVNFNKAPQNAVVVDLNFPAGVVEDALKEKMDKLGMGKGSSSKGYRLYKGVNWNDISADKIDVYTNVDGKKDNCTVTMLVSKGYDNFITSATDGEKIEKVKAMLNTFITEAAAYQLKLNIEEQEKVTAKAEKEYNGNVKDGTDLSKDKEKLEKKIAENKDLQSKTQSAWEKEKDKLNDLKKQMK